jgi:hypothetical protein
VHNTECFSSDLRAQSYRGLVQQEASSAKLRKSQWIGAIVTELFQGQELREEGRQNAEHIKRQLTFVICALDGLLAGHPDAKLRGRVHGAYRGNRGETEQDDRK